ncbi:hydrogen peroxide-inducible genes activator [Hyphobacterium indicum]|uniref:hydrogen peroxide-inducible genes activator n=1 Tax=Hyphobacterium indicum TaxID=2162714 RepID=UPI000D64E8FE|nr:hydrogen peroxide-inducible genes activator [Hyphobacterium indicum]
MAQPTLKQLSALIAIAETGLFRTAAEKLHVSQPALSEQISQLEYRLGARLLDRDRRGARLTPVGEAIAIRARRILADVSELDSLVRSSAENLGGLIRMGALPTLGPYLMPYVVPVLHARYPGLRLYVRETTGQALEDGLQAGQYDVALTVGVTPGSKLCVLPLFEEPLKLGIAHDDPLAGRSHITAQALAGRDVLTLEDGHRLTEQVKAIARKSGATILDDYQGTSLDGLRQMVGMGMGVSIFPQLYERSEIRNDRAVEARPFNSADAIRKVSLIWRENNPREKDFETLGGIIAARAAELLAEG